MGLCWNLSFCEALLSYFKMFQAFSFHSEQVFVRVLRFSDIVFATDSVPAVLGTTQDNRGEAGKDNTFF